MGYFSYFAQSNYLCNEQPLITHLIYKSPTTRPRYQIKGPYLACKWGWTFVDILLCGETGKSMGTGNITSFQTWCDVGISVGAPCSRALPLLGLLSWKCSVSALVGVEKTELCSSLGFSLSFQYNLGDFPDPAVFSICLLPKIDPGNIT